MTQSCRHQHGGNRKKAAEELKQQGTISNQHKICKTSHVIYGFMHMYQLKKTKSRGIINTKFEMLLALAGEAEEDNH